MLGCCVDGWRHFRCRATKEVRALAGMYRTVTELSHLPVRESCRRINYVDAKMANPLQCKKKKGTERMNCVGGQSSVISEWRSEAKAALFATATAWACSYSLARQEPRSIRHKWKTARELYFSRYHTRAMNTNICFSSNSTLIGLALIRPRHCESIGASGAFHQMFHSG